MVPGLTALLPTAPVLTAMGLVPMAIPMAPAMAETALVLVPTAMGLEMVAVTSTASGSVAQEIMATVVVMAVATEAMVAAMVATAACSVRT